MRIGGVTSDYNPDYWIAGSILVYLAFYSVGPDIISIQWVAFPQCVC